MAIRYKNNITAWARYCQLNRKCTIADLAGELGIARQTIHYWMRGTTKPSIKLIKDMSELSGGRFTPEMLRPDLF